MKCTVCGHEFELKKENRYTVKRKETSLLTSAVFQEYDCFDCPKCGCQNMVNKRMENCELTISILQEKSEETT
jgi:hypothetical protein